MSQKKRYRINPWVAITAMVCITALALGAQWLSKSSSIEWLKVAAAGIIMVTVGIKVRPKLPLT